MEKTTVYLTTAQKAALARAAATEGRSEARLIRAGIDVVTARHRVAEASAWAADEQGASMPAGDTGPGTRGRWVPREAFVRTVIAHPADAGLRAERRALAPDTTDADDRDVDP